METLSNYNISLPLLPTGIDGCGIDGTLVDEVRIHTEGVDDFVSRRGAIEERIEGRGFQPAGAHQIRHVGTGKGGEG